MTETSIQLHEGKSLSNICAKTTGYPMEINELQPNITIHTKFNLKWTIGLDINAKTLNFPKENTK